MSNLLKLNTKEARLVVCDLRMRRTDQGGLDSAQTGLVGERPVVRNEWENNGSNFSKAGGWNVAQITNFRIIYRGEDSLLFFQISSIKDYMMRSQHNYSN